MKLWVRYLFSRLLRSFFFFLISSFILYVLIDFAIQGSNGKIDLHYIWLFLRYIPLFFSFSFLLALLKTSLDLNLHREFTALQTGSLSLKKMSFPFFSFATFLCALSYVNYEWILPNFPNRTTAISKIQLQDGSEWVFRSYDEAKKELLDVFWIRSLTEFWHIQSILCEDTSYVGKNVEIFIKEPDSFEKKETLPIYNFALTAPFKRSLPTEFRSIGTLFKQKQKAFFYYKLTLPLTCFLLVFFILPLATKDLRRKSLFLMICGSIFAYVSWMMFLDASLILAENQVLPASLIFSGPFAMLTGIGLFSFFSRIR